MPTRQTRPPPLQKKQLSLDFIKVDPQLKQLASEHNATIHSIQQTSFIALAVKRWRKRARVNRARAWSSEDAQTHKDFKERGYSIAKPEVSGLQRFRRVARMVRILSAVCLTIRQYSRNRQDHGFLLELRKVQQDLEAESKCKENGPANSPDFDKESFARNRTLHFPLWARLICSKPSSERQLSECKKLCTYLRGMKNFTKFPRGVQLKLSQRMTYNHYDKHRILIRQGHLAHNFYFLLSGSLSVNIDTVDTKTGVNVTQTVDTLQPPCSFGENAFISDQRRTASVVSNEKVEVLVLDKSDFYDFCWEHIKKENEGKAAFLRSLPLFHQWDSESLQTILADVKRVQFPSGKLIEKDAEHSKYLYFVMEGSIDIIYGIDQRCLRRLKKEEDPLVRRATASALTCFSNEAKTRRSILVEGGSLVQNNAWGLETLLDDSPSCRYVNIYLESCGCSVMQITRRRVAELAPKGSLETFLQTYRPPIQILEDGEICRRYLQMYAWKEYRENVVKDIMATHNAEPICHISPTSKGNSGWAKWPGFQITQLPEVRTSYQRGRRPVTTM